MPILHPRLNDDDHPVVIDVPSQASAPETWADPRAWATFIPDGHTPANLNGIVMAPAVKPALVMAEPSDSPPMSAPAGFKPAAGAIILEADGRAWVVTQTNHFGGYVYTLPKGRIDPGGQPAQTAVREVFEETGLLIELTGWLGDFKRTMTFTRYYLARRLGGSPAQMGWESQAVHLVPITELPTLLTHPADAPVLAALRQTLRGDKSCG